MNRKGKKFVASYSGGKDSVLALYRAINEGMIPLCLIITYNTDKNQSWFHGITEDVLIQVSKSLDIPINIINTTGENYEENFEKELKTQKLNGAEFCIFGDIDIDEHLKWCKDRCESASLEAYFPLWQENRKDLVEEFIDSGFIARITVLDTERLTEKHLGLPLTKELITSIESEGADACGENGEYHTFVFDGPLFKHPLSLNFGDPIYRDKYALLNVTTGS